MTLDRKYITGAITGLMIGTGAGVTIEGWIHTAANIVANSARAQLQDVALDNAFLEGVNTGQDMSIAIFTTKFSSSSSDETAKRKSQQVLCDSLNQNIHSIADLHKIRSKLSCATPNP